VEKRKQITFADMSPFDQAMRFIDASRAFEAGQELTEEDTVALNYFAEIVEESDSPVTDLTEYNL